MKRQKLQFLRKLNQQESLPLSPTQLDRAHLTRWENKKFRLLLRRWTNSHLMMKGIVTTTTFKCHKPLILLLPRSSLRWANIIMQMVDEVIGVGSTNVYF